MPFRSITEPSELEAAARALESAWSAILAQGGVLPGSEASERERLAYIVAMLIPTMTAEAAAKEALRRFLENSPADRRDVVSG